MLFRRAWVPVAAAMICGVAVGWFFNSKQPVYAGGSSDRHEDFIMATGPINQSLTANSSAATNQFLNAELDGLWVLDYKSGKLLATTINRQTGKMVGFGEVDLVREFEIAPRANVHFMMSTGMVVKGQSVLYLIEATTGKLGVYSMLSSESSMGSNSERILIRRHDMTNIRNNSVPPPANVQNLGQPTMQPGGGLPANLSNQYNTPQVPQMPAPGSPQLPVNPINQTGFNPNK